MKIITRMLACAAVLLLLSGASSQAQEIKAGDLVIAQAWSRATPGGAKIAGGYLTVENKGTAPDRLIAVKLAPGGYHLMLMDLKNPLKQGEKVPLELRFEKAGRVAVSLDVQGVGAQGPAGAGHSGGQHDMKK